MQTRSSKRTAQEMTDREHAWVEIQKRSRFTVDELTEATPIGRANAEDLVQDLRQAGLIERVGRQRLNGQEGSFAVYELNEAPSGVPTAVGSRSPAWRQQVWNTLRIKREVTVPEVRVSFSDDVEVTRDTVYRYLRRLEKAGVVIRKGRQGSSGQKGSHIRYALHPKHERPNAHSKTELEQMTGDQ